MTVIAVRLKKARSARGLTQKQLSAISGVPQSTIARLETGEAANTKSIFKLATALKVKPEWLAGDKGKDHTIDDSDSGLNKESISSSMGGVMARATVRAGLWKDSIEWSEEEQYLVPFDTEYYNEYPADKCFALLVEGDSMDEDYKDGALLYCIPIEFIGRKLEDREHVIVERQHAGKYETTVKQIEFRQDGAVLLWPRSKNPDHQAALVISDPTIANRSDHTIIRVTALVFGHTYKRPSPQRRKP